MRKVLERGVVLTIFATFDQAISIFINEWQKITCVDGFSGKGACPRIGVTRAIVQFLNDVLGLVRTHATELGLERTLFVKHAVVESILGGFHTERPSYLSDGGTCPVLRYWMIGGHLVILVVSDSEDRVVLKAGAGQDFN